MATLEEMVLNSILGTGKRSTTTTTRGNISEEGTQRLIDQILAGNQGIAAISGGARAAGIYNSTTQQQLMNDLIARTTGEVEARRAGTTTTENVRGGGLSPEAALVLPLVTSVAKPLLQPTLNALGTRMSSVLGDAGSGLADLLGLGGGATSAATSAAPALSSGLSLGSSGLGLTAGLSSAAGNVGTLGSGLSDFLTGGSGLGLSAPAAVTGGLGGLTGGLGLPAGANVLSGLLGGFDSMDPSGLARNFAMATAIGGPLGGFAALGGQVLGGIVNDVLSVVCTALLAKGLLDKELYAAGMAYLRTLSPRTIRGYYSFGIPIAAKINSGSKFWTAVSLPFAKSRTSLLAGVPGLHILGRITKYIGEPVCYVIGTVLEYKDKFVKGSLNYGH